MKTSEKIHTDLREGFTTGTCAAAVSKAATRMLFSGERISHIQVELPQQQKLLLELHQIIQHQDSVLCSVLKDAGDDPDITHGVEVIAEAREIATPGLQLLTGKGIGKVTKPGLAVAVGQPAINPVPLKMIKDAVTDALPEGKGIEIRLSIPAGEELAKKTFNPRLGIVGGISVLGTSGIVKPMSDEALKSSLVLSLQQRKAEGETTAILSPGNYGRDFCNQHLHYNADKVVLTSNFIGFMLEQAVKLGFRKIVLVGHIGKLVKVAGGIFQTHSRVADARNEILAAHHYQYSYNQVAFIRMMKANTTDEAAAFVDDDVFWKVLANKVKFRCEQYIFQELQVEVGLFNQQGLLAFSYGAPAVLKELQDE